jgi:hypothetical protein
MLVIRAVTSIRHVNVYQFLMILVLVNVVVGLGGPCIRDPLFTMLILFYLNQVLMLLIFLISIISLLSFSNGLSCIGSSSTNRSPAYLFVCFFAPLNLFLLRKLPTQFFQLDTAM